MRKRVRLGTRTSDRRLDSPALRLVCYVPLWNTFVMLANVTFYESQLHFVCRRTVVKQVGPFFHQPCPCRDLVTWIMSSEDAGAAGASKRKRAEDAVDGSNGVPRKKTRTRVSYSCSECHRRKQKVSPLPAPTLDNFSPLIISIFSATVSSRAAM